MVKKIKGFKSQSFEKHNKSCIRVFDLNEVRLVAFACKYSFQRGHEGNVAFISKTQLVQHYIDTLGATHFGGRLMIIHKEVALNLIHKYFTNII